MSDQRYPEAPGYLGAPQDADSYGQEEVHAVKTETEREMEDDDARRLESLAEEREEKSQASAAE